MSINKDKVGMSITALISGTACNFNCEYCYRKYHGVKEKTIPSKFNYSVEHMVKALSPDRLGCLAQIVIIGGGETLLHPDVVPLIKGLLAQGHIVDVVTNMTLNNRIDELLELPSEQLSRLIVKGSLHYNELKRTNNVDNFFNNIKRLIDAGASSYPLITINKTYIDEIDEICELCKEKLGAAPHCAVALNFKTNEPEEIYTKEFKKLLKDKFDSKVQDIYDNYIDENPRKHFCYAGKYSLAVDMETGNTAKCCGAPNEQNIFEDLSKPIILEPIGNNCGIGNCVLNYNLISFNIMEDFPDIETYAQIISKSNWIREKAYDMTNIHFVGKPEYSRKEKAEINKKVREKFKDLHFKLNKTPQTSKFKLINKLIKFFKGNH